MKLSERVIREIQMERVYSDLLRFFDGDREDMEVSHHIVKHQNLMQLDREYARYCILKAVRFNKSIESSPKGGNKV